MSLSEQTAEQTAGHAPVRHDWQLDEVKALYALPFNELLFQAHSIHRAHFNPNAVQVSTLLSIKTGGCPEDCGYCSQSAHHKADIERQKLMEVETVVEEAGKARAKGASRFCMGAAWRRPNERDFERVVEMVAAVKGMGMETCMTLGMLSADQAARLREAGLDYYNHNLDTSPEYYGEIITTRTYDDRLQTLEYVRQEGINVCAGGIIGMGESRSDRASLLRMLANLPRHPESVPINMLVQVEGTPLQGVEALDPLEFVRTIAVARILMPQSYVRLSAGRNEMSDETQALCYFAGANSIFYGERLLTTDNPEADADRNLFDRLGIQAFQ